ncbi:serine hydrolase domain-containing protein [Flexithrix dorotheae]|uniref:serine hydrolase domain-containing protein n=1 Tax=Flexithrix dorotheae TaxID=70993 RepID=UPI0003713517|nr:serine hydrolase [Flexithrix dorotheae]
MISFIKYSKYFLLSFLFISAPGFAQQITLLKNQDGLLPLKRLDTLNIGVVSFGVSSVTPFQQMLGNYTQTWNYSFESAANEKQIEDLKKHNLLIIGIHSSSISQNQISSFLSGNKTIVVDFTEDQNILKNTDQENSDVLLAAFKNSDIRQKIAAQGIFGGMGFSGRLEDNLGSNYKKGDGLDLAGGIRFKYAIPEEVGIDSKVLNYKIDSIAKLVIDSAAAPGCQILIAKDQKIILRKAYGFQTYDKKVPVSTDDLYDFASVTKITGPLPALMKLNDEGKFKLDEKFSTYWPDFKGTEKENIKVREVLAHYGQLQPYLVYWKNTLKKNGKYKWFTIKADSSKRFPLKVSEGLYLNRNYDNKIYKEIKKSSLLKEKKYVYSGLSFLLYPQIISDLSGKEYEDYLKNTFYKPLGAYTLTFNPYKHYPISKIIPTENDTFFRHIQLRGTVHDEAAAMFGGVAGNAGLFGTTNDLAKLMQMYMNMGEYGGVRFVDQKVLEEFTSYQFKEEGVRRGLGFDKPRLESKERGYVGVSASDKSFGHSGYTGAFTWADPEHDLLVVFLSNRVYQTRENRKIYQLNIYQNLHQTLYDLILKD